MPIRITIDVFTGRPNPVIELNQAESRRLTERIDAADLTAAAAAAASTGPPRLGYRGLLVEPVDAESESGLPKSLRIGGLQGSPDRELASAGHHVEEYVFGMAEKKLPKNVASFCRQEVERVQKKVSPARAAALARPPALLPYFDWSCACAPIYEPEWWNDGGQRQLLNNCYNYASNYRTDTFAQPGRGAGTLLTSVTCAGVKPLALLDGLEDAGGLGNQCPQLGHLVALVIAPGFDFHWYRKGWGGLWSHKIGTAPATDTDNAGNLIVDPRLAARGPYTDFCGFLIVQHGHIKLH